MNAFRKMRGMFAVAIWDARHGRLILARDRAGKKPLYYTKRDGALLFGSETKAILAALDEVPAVNADALLDFLTFGYVAGDRSETMLLDACRHGIFANHPGHYLLRVVDALPPQDSLGRDADL